MRKYSFEEIKQAIDRNMSERGLGAREEFYDALLLKLSQPDSCMGLSSGDNVTLTEEGRLYWEQIDENFNFEKGIVIVDVHPPFDTEFLVISDDEKFNFYVARKHIAKID